MQQGALGEFQYDVLTIRSSWSPSLGVHTVLGEHVELQVEQGFEPRLSSMVMFAWRF